MIYVITPCSQHNNWNPHVRARAMYSMLNLLIRTNLLCEIPYKMSVWLIICAGIIGTTTSQSITQQPNSPTICKLGEDVELGWEYDAESSTAQQLQWAYKNGDLVLTYVINVGSAQGSGFTGRTNFYSDTGINAGLRINSTQRSDCFQNYTMFLTTDADDPESTVELQCYTEAEIAPSVDIGDVNNLNVSTCSGRIDLTQSVVNVSADLSHIDDIALFEDDQAQLTISIGGVSTACNIPAGGTTCDGTLDLTSHAGGDDDLTVNFVYGQFNAVYTCGVTIGATTTETSTETTEIMPTVTGTDISTTATTDSVLTTTDETPSASLSKIELGLIIAGAIFFLFMIVIIVCCCCREQCCACCDEPPNNNDRYCERQYYREAPDKPYCIFEANRSVPPHYIRAGGLPQPYSEYR